jgi:Uma2 family endonuclease
MSVLQELKPIRDYHAFNAARWEEVIADPALESLGQRIETNRFGIILMSPNPGIDHGGWQADGGYLLRTLLPEGKVLTECPISTSEGVKLADAVWISKERLAKSRRKNVLTIAPEICIEILSPTNRRGEIEEKKRLYFETGAEEVWIVGLKGQVNFFHRDTPDKPARTSRRCPEFPKVMEAF